MTDNPQIIIGAIIGVSIVIGASIAYLTIPVIDILIMRKRMRDWN